MHVYYTKKITIGMYVIICSSVIFLSVVIFASAYGNRQLFRAPVNGDSNTVIIDPGHGDPDGGATGVDGIIEKDINLSISFKLRNMLHSAGYTVIMTREDDDEIYDNGSNTIRKKKISDLHNRLAIANSHPRSAFISIHQNISKSSKSTGSIVLYSPKNDSSLRLAQSIQNNITSMLQPQINRSVSPAKKNIYLLYNAISPSVLVECGFLSNPSECKLLEDDSYQNKMAFSIFCGILQFGKNLSS